MRLTAAQVDAFFAAIKDVRAIPGAWKPTDPAHPMAMVQAVQITDQTTAILQQHGFAPTEFEHVAYNASMAYAVLREGGKGKMRRKLDKAKAQQEKALAKLKGHMSPEQIQALSNHVNDALMALATMDNVPDENIELMKKYRDQMAQLGEK